MRRRWSLMRSTQNSTFGLGAEREALLLQQWSESADARRREELATQLLTGRQRAIYIWCRKQESDPDLAQDLTQEILLRALTAMRKVETRIHCFGAWIFTLTRNHCANHRRTQSRRPSIDGQVEIHRLFSTAPGPDTLAEARQERELARSWMQTALSSTERVALWMRVVDERSLDHIAESLGLEDRDRVRVLLQRARRRLLRAAKDRMAPTDPPSKEMRA